MKKRNARNNVRPLIQNWASERTEKVQIWIGSQMSTPSFLPIACDGSSATRNPILERVFPRL